MRLMVRKICAVALLAVQGARRWWRMYKFGELLANQCRTLYEPVAHSWRTRGESGSVRQCRQGDHHPQATQRRQAGMDLPLVRQDDGLGHG
ncbi:hypothetical protein SHAM105786_03960 [Shewanella amazonensis]